MYSISTAGQEIATLLLSRKIDAAIEAFSAVIYKEQQSNVKNGNDVEHGISNFTRIFQEALNGDNNNSNNQIQKDESRQYDWEVLLAAHDSNNNAPESLDRKILSESSYLEGEGIYAKGVDPKAMSNVYIRSNQEGSSGNQKGEWEQLTNEEAYRLLPTKKTMDTRESLIEEAVETGSWDNYHRHAAEPRPGERSTRYNRIETPDGSLEYVKNKKYYEALVHIYAFSARTDPTLESEAQRYRMLYDAAPDPK